MASIQHSLPDPKERIEEPADSWASNTLSALQPGSASTQPQDASTELGANNPFRTTKTTSTVTSTTVPTSSFPPTSTPSSTTATTGKPTLPSTHTPAHASTATTPGHEEPSFPGAFPSKPPTAGVVAQDIEKAKTSAQGILGTAAGYVPSQQQVVGALGTAGEKVKEYLPEGVKSYLPVSLAGTSPTTSTTLPSKEGTTSQPTTHTATGPLPGTKGERGVALLPDESDSSHLTTKGQTLLPDEHKAAPFDSHPGALEAKHEGRVDTGLGTAGSGVLANAAGTAREHLPSQETVLNTANAAGNTAYSMLPSQETVVNTASSAGRTAASVLPSQETVVNTASTAANKAGEYVPSQETVYNTAGNTASGVKSTAVGAASGVVHAVESAGEMVLGYVPERVKDYLPAAVVGSKAPTTSLPSHELGQNVSPQTHSATGPLPGPPGEVGVAVLPDERTAPTSTSSSKPHTTLPSQSTNLPGPTSETGVAVLPSERTHNTATTGGMADLHGTSLAKLPDETKGERGLPGYMGSTAPAGYNKDLSTAPSSVTTGADSRASTRTLPGSLAESTTSTAFSSSAAHPTGVDKEKEKKGMGEKAKDTMRKAEEKMPGVSSHSGNTDNNVNTNARVIPAVQGESAMRSAERSYDHPSPSSTRATTGHDVPTKTGSIGSAGDRLATVSAGAHPPPHGSSTQHTSSIPTSGSTAPHPSTLPDTSNIPTKPTDTVDSTRHAGATEARVDPQSNTTTGAPARSGTYDNIDGGVGEAGSTPTKIAFLNKLKGEVKVISGKIGHDADKVEEGRRMMGKN